MARRWPDWAMSAYCLGQVVVGVLGAVDTSDAWPGRTWLVAAYSVLLAACGIVGIIGIIRRIRDATVKAVIGMTLGTVAQGVVQLAAGDPAVAVRLLISPLMMVPAIMGWRYWLEAREHPRGEHA